MGTLFQNPVLKAGKLVLRQASLNGIRQLLKVQDLLHFIMIPHITRSQQEYFPFFHHHNTVRIGSAQLRISIIFPGSRLFRIDTASLIGSRLSVHQHTEKEDVIFHLFLVLFRLYIAVQFFLQV